MPATTSPVLAARYPEPAMSGQVRRLPWYLRYRVASELGSLTRLVMVRLTHRHCRVEFRGPVHLGPGFSLWIPEHGQFVVGANCTFRRDFVCEINGQGSVRIGANTVFTSSALIQCSTSIEIGEWCALGQAVQIADGKHRFHDPSLPTAHQGFEFRPIHIGNGVSITSKCTILADVGDNAVIGANSVVTNPVPGYSLAVGAPARVVGSWRSGPPAE